MSDKLVEAIVEMQEEDALRLAEELSAGGEDPMKILDRGSQAMKEVGRRFESGEYFLPHLIMAGEILKRVSALVKSRIEETSVLESGARVVIGTVEGDIHNIGKDIVVFLLEANGFEVRDLGVDVPPARFVQEIRDFMPEVVGLSGLLTLAYDSMKKTVEAIQEAGLRDTVRVMIGGAATSEKVKEYVKADAYGPDAVAAVALAKKWTRGAA